MRCLFGFVVTWMLAAGLFTGPAAAQPAPSHPSKETAPPVLRITAPRQTVVNDVTPAITVEYSDGGSGVDLATLRVMVDSTDVTPGCTAGAASATCEPRPVAAGSHTITARLSDLDGNLATASFTFNLLLGLGPHTASFQAAADTYLQQGNPNENKGGEATLSIESRDTERALVRFDGTEMASVLNGATVVSAAVELYIETNSSNAGLLGRTVEARRMTAAWSELGATWTCPVDTDLTNEDPNCATPWNGGSFAALPTSQVIVLNGQQGKVTFPVTADLIGLLGGTPANGWMFKMVKRTIDRQPGGLQLTAREGTAASQRPRLVVTFLTPLLPVDTTPPSLTIVSPANGSVVGVASPQIQVKYLDMGTGVNTSTLRVFLDGTELGAACTPGAYTAACQSPALAAGSHTVTAQVRDNSGNQASASSTFQVNLTPTDTTPPTLAITAPAGSVLYNQANPTVTVTYSDAGSGVSTATLRVSVDGVALTGCTVGAGSATCQAAGLETGAHTVAAEVFDQAGNRGAASSVFDLVIDDGPPEISISEPLGPVIYNDTTPAVTVLHTDSDSGVDPATLHVRVDGTDITAGCTRSEDETTCTPPALSAGAHTIEAEVQDRAGNPASTSIELTLVVDETPPGLTLVSPTGSQFSVGEIPTVELTYSDPGSGIDAASLLVQVDGASLDCASNAESATCSPPDLGEGAHSLTAEIRDQAGNRATASLALNVGAEQLPPSLAITAPDTASNTGLIHGATLPAITIEYSDPSGIDTSSLVVRIDGADATASCQAGAASATCAARPAGIGLHAIEAEIRDVRGNLATARREIELSVALEMSILTPAQGTITREAAVTITGTVSPLADSVTIEGIGAALNGGTFTVNVPLREGNNTLTAVARSAAGGVGSATLSVVRDGEAPKVVVMTPKNGFVTSSSQVVVAGEVIDPASSNGPVRDMRVLVNGLPAQVNYRGFLMTDLLLQPGENRITVSAEDTAGNTGTAEVTVTFLTGDLPRMEEVMGNLQTGGVGQTLPLPLVVRLTDFAGNPQPGRSVTFAVTRGNGAVISLPDAARKLTVQSDEQGFAEVRFALGGRAGAGTHEVTVTSPGFPGSFVFSASARAGVPKLISPITGSDFQGARSGAAGLPMPKPLLTQVFDELGNPIAGAEVLYRVTLGSGSFAGNPSFTAVTDAEGKASAVFTLGPEEGVNNNRVEADFEGHESPAIFLMSALIPGPEAATAVSGVVLDPQDGPIPGARVHIGTVETRTDAAGRFQLTGIPVGTVHLEIDGSTVTRPGTWPHLGYEMVTVSGRDNTIGKPVRLPPIDADGARLVGGSEDVVLPIKGVAGATLTVFANSATFPDGSRTGLLSFSQVPADKVPMVAPLGSGFQLAWTIQPANVRFDPPARVSVPNFGAPEGGGNPPGMVVDIYTFDHDMGEFVGDGTASISEDGRQMISNPGFGVFKTGWGGCPKPPAPPAHACGSGTCNLCVLGTTAHVPACSECQICMGGEEGCQPRRVTSVVAEIVDQPQESGSPALAGASPDADEFLAAAATPPKQPRLAGVGQELPFRVGQLIATCAPDKIKATWSFGDGSDPQMGRLVNYAYKKTGSFNATVKVECEGCPEAGNATDTTPVKVVDLIEGRFKVIGSETKLDVEEDDEDHDGKPDNFFRVLGGMRLKLSVASEPLLAGIKEYRWSANGGRFFKGFKTTDTEITGDQLKGADLKEIYWEGEWAVNQDLVVSLSITYGDKKTLELKRRIKTRVLKLANPAIPDGDDIRMLQELLRMLGFAEASVRGNLGVGGVPVMVTGSFSTGTKRAVLSFQDNDGIGQDGVVGGDALGKLSRQWPDYRQVFEKFSSDPVVSNTHPQFPNWIFRGAIELQRTFTFAQHQSIAPGVAYVRLVESWINQESGVYGHWGFGGHDHRITMSLDDFGSIGFDQIKIRNKYGATDRLSDLNLYDPSDNVLALARFSNDLNLGGGFARAFTGAMIYRDSTTWGVDDYPRVGRASTPRQGRTYQDDAKDQLSKGIWEYNSGTSPLVNTYPHETWPEILKAVVPPPNSESGTTRSGIRYSLRVQGPRNAYEQGVGGDIPLRSWWWTDRFIIKTGGDKACTSTRQGDDVAMMVDPNGQPDQICFCPGADGVLQTRAHAQDELVEFEFQYSEAEWLGQTSWSQKRRQEITTQLQALGCPLR